MAARLGGYHPDRHGSHGNHPGSNSTNAGLELSAKADLSAGISDLGKAELGFSLRSQRGDIWTDIGATDVTPFFQVAVLKKPLFGEPRDSPG